MTTSIPAKREETTTGRPAVGGSPTAGRRIRPRKRRPISERQRPLWMLAPGGFLMLVIIVVPLLVALYISLLDLDQYTFRQWIHAPFIGIHNYLDALHGSDFLHGVWLSVSYAVVVTVISLPIGVLAALATQTAFKGRGLVRSIFLVPYVLPAFVLGEVWRTILQPGGVANSILGNFGIHGGLWLNGPKSYWSLVIVQTWASWPLIYLLVLAGLQAVDPVMHEAAALDGAGWWSKLRYVILPHLGGPVALGLLISFLHNVNNFTLPFVLFGVPAPHNVAVLPVLTYVTSFQNFQFGLSAAMAVFSLLLIAIPLGVYLRAVRLDTGTERRR